MRTKTIEIYTFDELNDDAKERAREGYRPDAWETGVSDDYVIDDFLTMAVLLGVEIDREKVYYSGFCHQGQGASFEGSYGYAKGSAKAIRQEAPLDTDLHEIADSLADVQKRNFYQLDAHVKQGGHGVHDLNEMSMRIEVTRWEYTEMTEGAADTVTKALRDLARWLYRQLNREYDYVNSDEAVDESILANEYEFDAQGERI